MEDWGGWSDVPEVFAADDLVAMLLGFGVISQILVVFGDVGGIENDGIL